MSSSNRVSEQERPVVDWINSLHPSTAAAMLSWVEMVKGPIVIDTSRSTADVTSMVRLNDGIPGPDGLGWSAWVTCRVLPKQAGEKRHQRLQINLAANAATAITPVKDNSQGAQIKRILSEDDWQRLKEAACLTTGGRAIVKLWAHHLACRANGQARYNIGFDSMLVCSTLYTLFIEHFPNTTHLLGAVCALQCRARGQRGPSV